MIETPTTQAVDPEEALAIHTWNRQHQLEYKLRLSALYHLSRERFFSACDKSCTMLTAVFATAAFATLIKEHQGLDAALAGLTAVLSLMPVVFAPSDSARHHGQLAVAYRHLRTAGARAGETWTPAQCDEFVARMLEIEASEPMARGALVIDCQNRLALTYNQPELVRKLNWLERSFKQWWDFDAPTIMARTA